MSAIEHNAPSVNVDVDGLRRYTTRIKAVVHSHNHHEPIYLSDDVMSCSIGKNINGAGKANLALVASKSYINLLYPDDILNIYFDIGDGSGWTRTFFGFLDRIEEEYSVTEAGEPQTLFHVIATDFQKVLEKTQIYFNPHLALRQDVQGTDFDTINLGGVAMLSRGIKVAGSPADMVLNQLMLQLGFGTQWILPDCYRPALDSRLEARRREYANGRLLDSVRNSMRVELYERLRELANSGELTRIQQSEIPQEGSWLADATAVADPNTVGTEDGVRTALERSGLEESDVTSSDLSTLRSARDARALNQAIHSIRLRREVFGSGLNEAEASRASNYLQQYLTAVSANGNGRSLLDVLNIFDFVERRAIDGYAFDLSLWERQGALISILRSMSNEVVNELIFDLRPMNQVPENISNQDSPLVSGADWDRRADDINGNLPDEQNNKPGIKYMPAVIMREYPFSTVNNVDASNVSIGLDTEDSTGQRENYGILHFGAIFSDAPNTAGRHLVNIPVLNVEDRAAGRASDQTKKHLDVAVISDKEINTSSFGRSDADHFNLFEMFTENVLGSDQRYYMKDFLPIVTPLHIMRHGLRVRSVSTRFSRFDLRTATRTQQTVAPAEEPEESQEPTEGFSEDLVPPVGADPRVRFADSGGQKYGYRHLGGRDVWRFHNGIDIYGVDGETDVVAIADGEVVCSAPNGVFSRYGNMVVIHHPQFTGPNGEPVYSLYAHMASRDPRVGNTEGSLRRPSCVAADCGGGVARGEFQKIRVNKGDVIGKVGRTSGTAADRNGHFDDVRVGPHLHFEIDYHWPPKNDRANPNIPLTTVPATGSLAQVLAASSALGGNGTNSNPYNTDPVAFFSSKGVNLVAKIAEFASSSEVPVEEQTGDEGGDDDSNNQVPLSRQAAGNPQDQVSEAQNSPNNTLRGAVDTIDSRKQLGRWALLQDHWYQHNLEYLSGQVVMRGAPEIRVGYRLDILERRMSFYVESVQHSWQYPNEMKTTLQVTRGQPNNPYPAYALPPVSGLSDPSSRRASSRLGHFFITPDPIAVRRAIAIRKNSVENNPIRELVGRSSNDNTYNVFDDPDSFEEFGYEDTLMAAESFASSRNEELDSADIEAVYRAIEISQEAAQEENPGLDTVEGATLGTEGVA